jgi:hypothetical protein
MATKLQIEDVTNVAENDDRLKERYKEVVSWVQLYCCYRLTNAT